MSSFNNIYDTSLKMLASGKEKNSILTYMASEAEKLIGNDSAVSILLLDNSGLLRNGASPKLPEDYLKAIDGIKPHPRVGTCAAAAATGEVVLTPDFRADDKWVELKHLPLSIGYTGAWSQPIKTETGKVLGTFGTYYKDVREPSNEELFGIELLASAAATILTTATK